MYSELCVHVLIFASELVIDEAKFYTREQLLVFWVFFQICSAATILQLRLS